MVGLDLRRNDVIIRSLPLFPCYFSREINRDYVNLFDFYLIRVKILLDFQQTSGKT